MNILFVDDEEGLLDQAKIFLEQMEYDFNVSTVRSSEEALEKLNNENHDAIISDYQMPQIDGLELLEIIRKEKNRDLPFIIFTGRGREEVAIKALNLGADRYIQKGGSPKSQYGILAEAINQEVRRHQIESKLELTQYSVDKASASIYWIRPDGSFVYTNDKVKDRLGYTSEELDKMHVWDVDPNHGKDMREEQWKRIKDEKVITFRTQHKTKNGDVFPVDITSHYIEHEGEEYEFAFSRDITERIETREVLEKSEKRYKTMFEFASDGIVLLDEDGVITECNSTFVEILGYEKSEIIGKTPADFSPDVQEDGELSAKKVKRYVQKTLNGENPSFEWLMETKDDSKLFTEISLKKIKINDETKIIAMKRDISQRKKAEKEIKKEKKKFKEIFNNANDAIYLHELTEEGMPGNFIEVNDVACEMLGFSREEFMEMSPGDIDAGKKKDDVPDIMEKLTEEGDLRFEMTHITKNGKKIPVELHSHVFNYEGEKRVLSVARDISKRKEAEIKLKKSERRFRKSFEALPDPAFLVDKEGVFQNVNEAAEEKLGYAKEDIIGKTLSEMPFITGEEEKKALKVFEKRKEGVDVSPYVLEFISKDGKSIFTEINAGTFKEDGFKGEIVIARDITEEKRSKRELKVAQQRLELALKGAELGVWDWNIKSDEVKFNKKWANMIGFSLDEIDQNFEFWEERVHPEDLSRVKRKLEKHLKGEIDIYRSEHRMKTKTGEWIWIKDVGKVFERDENGEPLRAVGVHEDITKRKKTEEKLKESEKRYRELSEELENILDHIPGLVYYKDKENNLIRVNEALAEAHGMTKEEMEGKNLFDLYPEEEAEKYLEDDREVIENREPKLNMVEPWSPEEKRWLSTSKIPYVVDGEVRGIIGISIDITEEKKTQEREELLHTILRHDVKNKVQVVQGYLQLLDQQELTGESRDYLQKALKGNKESMNLLNKIRLLLKAQKEVKKDVNISNTVHEAVHETESLAKDMGFEIDLQCPSMECKAKAGPLLKEVFSNIIENSVQHSNGERIKISGEIKNDEITCTIEDDGKGIPEEEKKSIFEKGYTTDQKRGTGLGMFIVKLLLDTYEGKIEVNDSELGGARFDIHLKRCSVDGKR